MLVTICVYLQNWKNMKAIKTKIKDLLILEPDVFGDDRGYFFESFNNDLFNTLAGKEVNCSDTVSNIEALINKF